MRYLVNQHTGELEGLPSIPIASSEEKNMFLKGDGTYADVNLDAFTGATDQTNGGRGTVPAPLAGDQDKVLQGNGSWGKKLQFDVVIQNGKYGYINSNNEFVSFKSQADIDAAVTAAKVGTATAADVLSGKTFTNSTDSGLAGSMENLSTNNRYQHDSNNVTPTILGDAGFFTTVYDKVAGTNLGDYFEIRYNGSPNKNASNNDTANGYIKTNTLLALPSQTKTVTPTTSAQTVSPDSNKVLKSVTVSAISTQEKTVTGSRSAQTVTPDSGKYLSKVTVNKYPDATGTYTTTTRGTAVDMGATNNYRYVNTNGVTNTNSGTYTMGTASTGATYDMGSTNTYRYVNAANVYNKGKSDGAYAGTATVALFDQYYYEQWRCTDGAGYYICIAKASSTSKTPGINCSTNCSLVKTLVSGYNGVSVFLVKGTSSTFSGTFTASNYTHVEYKLS